MGIVDELSQIVHELIVINFANASTKKVGENFAYLKAIFVLTLGNTKYFYQKSFVKFTYVHYWHYCSKNKTQSCEIT